MTLDQVLQTKAGVTVDQMIDMLNEAAGWASRKYRSITRYMEPDDIVSECMAHFLEKGFFEKYNSGITSFKYFLFVGVRHWVINYLTRKRVKTVSADAAQGGEEEMTIVKILSVEEKDPLSEMMAAEILSVLDAKERLQPSFVKSRGTEMRLSERNVMSLFLDGWTKTEISKIWGITSARVGQIVAAGVVKIRESFFPETIEEVAA